MLKRLLLKRRKNRCVAFCACFLIVVFSVSGCDSGSKDGSIFDRSSKHSNPPDQCKKRHPSPTSECLKPALVPIGDQKVMLGSSLEIKISATDPDPDSILTFSAEWIDGPARVSFDPLTQMLTWNSMVERVDDQFPTTLRFKVCNNCPAGPLCDEEIVTFEAFLPLEQYAGQYNLPYYKLEDIESGRVASISFSYADESKKELSVEVWGTCDSMDTCYWGRVKAEYNDTNGDVTAKFQLDWGTSTLLIKKEFVPDDEVWVIESRDYTEEDGREDTTYEYPLANV